MKLSVVFFTLNEEENLKKLVPRIISTLRKVDDLLHSYEILIIDAFRSTDNSEQSLVDYSCVVYKRVAVDDDTYAGSVRLGIKTAKGDYILCLDADCSHPPEYLEQMVRNYSGNDLIICSRYLSNTRGNNDATAMALSRILNTILSFIININITDYSSGFRMYKKNLLSGMTLESKHFEVLQEILIKMVHSNPELKIKEIPFVDEKRVHGESARKYIPFIWGYAKIMFRILELRFLRLKSIMADR